jgi:hypothetical protein
LPGRGIESLLALPFRDRAMPPASPATAAPPASAGPFAFDASSVSLPLVFWVSRRTDLLLFCEALVDDLVGGRLLLEELARGLVEPRRELLERRAALVEREAFELVCLREVLLERVLLGFLLLV